MKTYDLFQDDAVKSHSAKLMVMEKSSSPPGTGYLVCRLLVLSFFDNAF